MARVHKSHDFPANGYCTECTCYVLSIEAELKCRPSTDDSQCAADPAPAPDIDYSAITRGFAG